MHNKIEEDQRPALKCQSMYKASQRWVSSFRFMEDELKFIERLLHSYVFEPNTPNLFERLQDYLVRIEAIKEEKGDLFQRIIEHEHALSGLLESKDQPGIVSYSEIHHHLELDFNKFLDRYWLLKSEIFNYAGAILKKRKP